jgi:hypothetical protein
MTRDESPLPADASLVTCTKCGERSPIGTRQCSNTKCRCLLPGNPGRQGEVPGVSASRRGGGPDALTQRGKDLFGLFSEQAVADLGGISRISMVEMSLIEAASMEYSVMGMIGDYLHEVSPLTPRGRVRSALTAFQQAVDRLDRIGQKLGLQRRDGWEQAHRDLTLMKRLEAGEDVEAFDENDDLDDEMDDDDE